MKIDCENCGNSIDCESKNCSICGFSNSFVDIEFSDSELNYSSDSCQKCIHFNPSKDIQCNILAEAHKWDRDKLEIDCPNTFYCGGFDEKK